MKKNSFSFLLLVAFLFLSLNSSAQAIFINEVSVCNISNEMDAGYNYSGWIELYNSSDQSVNLKTLLYSDDTLKVKKYQLKVDRFIPARGFATIWLNDEVSDGNGLFLNTDPDGGYLALFDAKGALINEIKYPKQYTNVSYGRTNDGGSTFGYFLNSSRELSNNGSQTSTVVVGKPIFSLKGGFYSSSIDLAISCETANAKIYYTLDGSDPGKDKILYDGNPIKIQKTIPVRAKAFADGYLNGVITSATYMINERVPKLPVFFITTDPKNLYDNTIGIYCVGTNGIAGGGTSTLCNYNQNWTRPANVEFLSKDKVPELNQMVGIEINGNASRHYAQKSFKIKAGNKYGKNRLDYQFFAYKTGRRFKSIILRNGGQDNDKGSIRDAFLQKTTDILNVDHQAYQPAVVYINGAYWGYLNITERHSADYIYSNYDYNEEEIDMVENNWIESATTGNLTAYRTMSNFIKSKDLTIDANYEEVRKMVDVDSYINYMAVEIFASNDDWPGTNQTLFRTKDNGKWRWLFNDLDNCYKQLTPNKLKELMDDSGDKFPVKMITYLLKNEKFKEQYINSQCIVAGSVFSTVRTSLILDSILAKLDSEYKYHQIRWNQVWYDHNWLYENVDYLKSLTTKLQPVTFNNLKTIFNLGETQKLFISSTESNVKLTFNSLEIPALPYDGIYFNGKTLKLSAPLLVNEKKFKHWLIVKDGIEYTDANAEVTFQMTGALSVNAVYETPAENLRDGLYINEVSASNSIFVDNYFKVEDWVEIFNASNGSIDMGGYYFSNDPANLQKFRFDKSNDKSLIIPSHQYAVIWCSNKTERGKLHVNFKLEKDGGMLFLSKDDGSGKTVIVDSLNYTVHSDETSFGRFPDGGDKMYVFDIPTFMKSNIYSTYNKLKYIQKFVLTDVKQINKDTDLKAYLNEEQNELFIINELNNSLSVSIFDISGRLILNGKTNERISSYNISKFTAGTFLLQLTGKEIRKTFKFQKQK